MKGFAIRGLVVAAAIALVWLGFTYRYSAEESAQNIAEQTQGDAWLALTGARVIDGTGAAPIDDATLLISQGRILAVGPSGSITIPDIATRVDMAGKIILPGLINAHGHVTVDDNTQLPMREHMEQRLDIYADYGVTAVV
ncbi:MAG: hypothetical protein V3S07_04650, partial [Micropepsaceae bacterium]